MLILSINGLEDGESLFELEAPAEKIECLPEEFHGIIKASGTVRKFGNRYAIEALATGVATLICDLSLEEYTEQIQATVQRMYVADAHKHFGADDDDSILYIREEDKFIDLTDEIAQQIAVHVPMKRVSPKYRDISFSELHPEHSLDVNPPDDAPSDRWAALKNISFDSHN